MINTILSRTKLLSERQGLISPDSGRVYCIRNQGSEYPALNHYWRRYNIRPKLLEAGKKSMGGGRGGGEKKMKRKQGEDQKKMKRKHEEDQKKMKRKHEED